MNDCLNFKTNDGVSFTLSKQILNMSNLLASKMNGRLF